MEPITKVTKNPKRVEAGKKGAEARRLKKMANVKSNADSNANSSSNANSNADSNANSIANSSGNVVSNFSAVDQKIGDVKVHQPWSAPEGGKWLVGLGIAGIAGCLYIKRNIKHPTPPSPTVERDPFVM